MKADIVSRVRSNPKFLELETKRNAFGSALAVAILVIYYGFILLVAFAPGFMGTKIGDTPVTVGFPIGLFVIASAIVLTGVYVLKANGEYDRLTREIVEDTR
jgi:uncharacterized membrane protein (DUF485 family)